jgi:hypothetical protein
MEPGTPVVVQEPGRMIHKEENDRKGNYFMDTPSGSVAETRVEVLE